MISLILAFSTGLWGAWFLLLLALVLWYKPYLVEGVFVVVRERRDRASSRRSSGTS